MCVIGHAGKLDAAILLDDDHSVETVILVDEIDAVGMRYANAVAIGVIEMTDGLAALPDMLVVLAT